MKRAMGIAVAAVVVLLAILPASAQTPRTERLDNGFTIIVRENPLAPVVAISLLVKTGTRWEGKVAILSGLSPGDRVVAAGQIKLQDGAPVVVTANPPPPPPANPTPQ